MIAIPERTPTVQGVTLLAASLVLIWTCHLAGLCLPLGWLNGAFQGLGIAGCGSCVWGGALAIQAEVDASPTTVGKNAIWSD